jgi:hypothetical protein
MMLGSDKQGSEVARLLAQIRAEYEAGERALKAISYGSARHEFINARMENIERLHTELHDLVGDEAMAIITEQFDKGCDIASVQPGL